MGEIIDDGVDPGAQKSVSPLSPAFRSLADTCRLSGDIGTENQDFTAIVPVIEPKMTTTAQAGGIGRGRGTGPGIEI